MTTSLHAAYFSVKVFSETDTTGDLKKIEVPVLIVHGDDDQLVPLPNTGAVIAKLLRNATFKVYPGEPHNWPSLRSEGQPSLTNTAESSTLCVR